MWKNGFAGYRRALVRVPIVVVVMENTTEIDFALSFGAVILKMIDLSKTESRDFFGIIIDQKNSQKLLAIN